MKDPYEEYARHERRRSRIQVVVVVGFVLLLAATISAAVMWHVHVAAVETGESNTYLVSKG
jgi:hypothetical protein